MPIDVELRDVLEDDLPIFFEHQTDAEASAMAAFAPRAADSFFAHWRTILADPAVTAKTIVWGGVVAGNVVAFEREGVREVGYWIGRAHWGRGIASRALAAFLRIETARPLRAGVAAHNAASIRVLEKCGFIRIGEEKAFAKSTESEIPGLIFELR